MSHSPVSFRCPLSERSLGFVRVSEPHLVRVIERA